MRKTNDRFVPPNCSSTAESSYRRSGKLLVRATQLGEFSESSGRFERCNTMTWELGGVFLRQTSDYLFALLYHPAFSMFA